MKNIGKKISGLAHTVYVVSNLICIFVFIVLLVVVLDAGADAGTSFGVLFVFGVMCAFMLFVNYFIYLLLIGYGQIVTTSECYDTSPKEIENDEYSSSKIMYACPKCKQAYSGYATHACCPDCKTELKKMNVSVDEWHKLNDNEKKTMLVKYADEN